MLKRAKIKKLQELIENLSVYNFTGVLEVRFNSGGISSVLKTEKFHLEKTKI